MTAEVESLIVRASGALVGDPQLKHPSLGDLSDNPISNSSLAVYVAVGTWARTPVEEQTIETEDARTVIKPQMFDRDRPGLSAGEEDAQ